MGVHLVNQAGQTVVAITTKTFHSTVDLGRGSNTYEFAIQNILSEGEYSISIAIKQKSSGIFLIKQSDLYSFSVVGIDSSKYNPLSLVYPTVRLTIKSPKAKT